MFAGELGLKGVAETGEKLDNKMAVRNTLGYEVTLTHARRNDGSVVTYFQTDIPFAVWEADYYSEDKTLIKRISERIDPYQSGYDCEIKRDTGNVWFMVHPPQASSRPSSHQSLR